MLCLSFPENLNVWRTKARRLLQHNISPQEVLWEEDGSLFPSADFPSGSAQITPALPADSNRVPAAFLSLAKLVACFNDTTRWSLLYQILWRLVKLHERSLLEIASDPLMTKARGMEKAVRREIHKMHAFVRFRKCGEDASSRESYVAWFEPQHFIIEAAAPFFRDRFANMDWSIFSPRGCAHWSNGKLQFTPGVPHDPTANTDAVEEIWRTYYASIFNPARLKLKAMQAEMPKRYWKNLPEAELIESLIRTKEARLSHMAEQMPRPVRPLRNNKYLDSLALREKGENPTESF